ncbi:mammalian cell entry protein [Synechococcus sp. 65AY6Li]|uniref:MlaD family protein n=1 Tax=Synechococcus sp. 65AY6Li TaxID=1351840 RepID=UPI000C184D6E|nr:MlaD family protein [Synechococcus sp. 65AY6Li]PIK92699.1 mammalian cell entry protein [Synechococcus sp. 65AY6Li]
MRSRAIREGAVGLLILAGALGFAGLFLWIYNLRFGSRGFRFTVTYPNVAGLAEGSSVRLRGVAVGRVERILPQAAQVEVQVAIDQPLIIPRDALFITKQTGLVGETVVDILPRGSVEGAVGSPLAADCDRSQIICDGDVVEGKPGVDFGQLLIRLERLLARVDDDEVFSTLNATLEGITRVADSVANLSETLEERVAALRTEDLDLLQFTEAARAVSQTAASLQEAADQFTALLLENRTSLQAALENIQQVSADLQAMSSAVRPLLTDPQLQADVRQILAEVRAAAENVSQATDDLRQLAASLNDPGTLATLRQTLDSARITFQNAQKITADIDELTGDPQFRRALRELVLGLSNLVSSAPSDNGIQPAAVQVAPVSFTLAPMGQQPVPQEEAKIPAEIRSPSSGKSH